MVKSLWLFKNGRATKKILLITNFSLLIGKLTNFPYLCPRLVLIGRCPKEIKREMGEIPIQFPLL